METIHAFERTGSGAPRKRPYELSGCWYELGDELSLFVFGPAAQTPFGLLDSAQEREAGELALEVWRRDR